MQGMAQSRVQERVEIFHQIRRCRMVPSLSRRKRSVAIQRRQQRRRLLLQMLNIRVKNYKREISNGRNYQIPRPY